MSKCQHCSLGPSTPLLQNSSPQPAPKCGTYYSLLHSSDLSPSRWIGVSLNTSLVTLSTSHYAAANYIEKLVGE